MEWNGSTLKHSPILIRASSSLLISPAIHQRKRSSRRAPTVSQQKTAGEHPALVPGDMQPAACSKEKVRRRPHAKLKRLMFQLDPVSSFEWRAPTRRFISLASTASPYRGPVCCGGRQTRSTPPPPPRSASACILFGQCRTKHCLSSLSYSRDRWGDPNSAVQTASA